MKPRSVFRDIAIMIIFPATGLLTFTENVRTLQVLGLLASGAVFGVYLSRALMSLKSRKAAD
ncbi:MAG TPA: hypothetical protein VJO14_02715 [Bacteroidota bacterium]|nr:hypothetical protein [Bacteroidota bacterium]